MISEEKFLAITGRPIGLLGRLILVGLGLGCFRLAYLLSDFFVDVPYAAIEVIVRGVIAVLGVFITGCVLGLSYYLFCGIVNLVAWVITGKSIQPIVDGTRDSAVDQRVAYGLKFLFGRKYSKPTEQEKVEYKYG